MATPIRNVRVPDDVWHAAAVRAADDGTTVSAIIVGALRDYGRVAACPPSRAAPSCRATADGAPQPPALSPVGTLPPRRPHGRPHPMYLLACRILAVRPWRWS